MPQGRTTEEMIRLAKRVRPETDDDLWNYIAAYMGVHIPRVPITLRPGCAHHCTPFDYIGDMFFEREGDCIVWANRGGSKTYGAALVAMLEHLFKPGLQTRILGGSQEQSKRMYEHFQPFCIETFAEFIKGESQQLLTRFKNGGKVEILAASMRSVLGHHIPRLKLDEVDEFDEDVLEAAMGTSMDLTRRGKVIYASRVEELSTFHHPFGVMSKELERTTGKGVKRYNWCIFETLEHCGPEHSCSQCSLWEDCQGVAKKECNGYITVDNAIKWKQRHSKEGWDAWFLCKKPYAGRSFFRSYDPDIHVAREPIPYDPNLPLYRAWDWGTNGPTACLWIQVDERGPHPMVRVIDEMREDHAAASDMVKAFVRYHKERGYGRDLTQEVQPGIKNEYCDPSGLSYVLEWNKAGIYPVGRGGGKRGTSRKLNARMEGWEIVRQLLRNGVGKSSLIISPKCQWLPSEFADAHFPERKPNQPVKEDMVEVNDHSLAALRYFCLGRFPQLSWQFATAGRPRRRTR